MKAIVYHEYGPPHVLKIQEVKTPIIQKKEVLVRIHATAVNSGDVRARALVGEGILKLVMRLALGITKPRKPILGVVYAGVVEEIDSEVSQFQKGDRVFGMTGFRFSTYAEYIAISEKDNIYPMPKNASFEEAASIIFGGQTAIYFLQKAGIPKIPSAKVLIYGATGSVGASAVQIAEFYGAEVTAVCSSRGKKMMADLGVSQVIFYDKDDFTKGSETYDLVFDAVGKITKKQCQHLLKEKGIFKTVGGFETASESVEQLKLLKELFENGKLKATIDKVYEMKDVVQAHEYVDTGRKQGNVVLRIGEEKKK